MKNSEEQTFLSAQIPRRLYDDLRRLRPGRTISSVSAEKTREALRLHLQRTTMWALPLRPRPHPDRARRIGCHCGRRACARGHEHLMLVATESFTDKTDRRAADRRRLHAGRAGRGGGDPVPASVPARPGAQRNPRGIIRGRRQRERYRKTEPSGYSAADLVQELDPPTAQRSGTRRTERSSPTFAGKENAGDVERAAGFSR